MLRLDINLANVRPGAWPARAVAAALCVIAAAYTVYSVNAWAGNRSRITAYGQRLASLARAEAAPAPGAAGDKKGSGDAARLRKEAEFINKIIVRESFSWTRLLTNLERSVPENVSIVQISPEFAGNKIVITGAAKGLGDAIIMVERLGASAAFKDVFLIKHAEKAEERPMMMRPGMPPPPPPSGERLVLFTVSATYVTEDPA
ncbi:MAG: PilN domain-containing protein [Deltaproteobacteria bacterium]|nr:PilN domain-containing protein [Deltaproteobacteria bacterium]